jgi:hypothetical protein
MLRSEIDQSHNFKQVFSGFLNYCRITALNKDFQKGGPTRVQGSDPSALNFFTTYGGIEPRTLRSSQISPDGERTEKSFKTVATLHLRTVTAGRSPDYEDVAIEKWYDKIENKKSNYIYSSKNKYCSEKGRRFTKY